MEIQELRPFSANWNQIKSEYSRNNDVFEKLKKAVSDEKVIAAFEELIKDNNSAIKTMNEIEKHSEAFDPKPQKAKAVTISKKQNTQEQ